MTKLLVAAVAVCGVMVSSAAQAQELTKMDPELAKVFGMLLAEQFDKVEGPQVKVEADAEKAVGLVLEMSGIVLVPSKTLKEGEIDEAVETEEGSALAYLFMSPQYNPLIDGKPVDEKAVRTVEFMTPDGMTVKATALILAARHVEGDDWRLYVYGADKKPVLEPGFAPAAEPKEGAIDLEVKDVKDDKGTLVITVMGMYEASFEISHKAE